MKAILTFSLVLFFGGISLAQEVKNDQKVTTNQESVVLVESTDLSEGFKTLVKEGQIEIARLYRQKNSRVKSALFFTTKKDRPKLA